MFNVSFETCTRVRCNCTQWVGVPTLVPAKEPHVSEHVADSSTWEEDRSWFLCKYHQYRGVEI